MLRNLEDKDKYGMLTWMKDPVVMRYFRFSTDGATIETVQNFIENANIMMEEKKAYHFAIVNDLDDYLGTVSLKNVDWNSLNAEYAIVIRRDSQGQNYGFNATNEILKKGFEEMGLRRIYLNVISENKSAIGLYEKVGFICEGEFRKHLNIHGEIYSLKWYSMLLEEYQKLYVL